MARSSNSKPSPAWYANGLKFECQPDCGACCANHGDYAFVYLEDGELDRLATFLGLSPAEFTRRHTSVDDGDVVLRMDEPECPFLDGSRCSVYPARPAQCRTFPFWEENLLSREHWERLGEFCPGIDRGQTHSRDLIQIELDARHP